MRCLLGLTATATQATASSVAEHLGITRDPGAVIRGGAVPPNLFLSVSCDSERTQVQLDSFSQLLCNFSSVNSAVSDCLKNGSEAF